MSPRVSDLLAHLDDRIPFAWAEEWDRVGMLVGDPEAAVGRILVSLDPTVAALQRAIGLGAGVLLTHHPAFLDPPASFTATGPGRVAFLAARAGVALVACHTNLDRAPEGAEALPALLGTPSRVPIEQGSAPVAVIIAYVPEGAVADVRSAMQAAGAGIHGRYAGCSFAGTGEGSYIPMPGAREGAGPTGQRVSAHEVRLEMTCPPERAAAVAAAARAAHPYEEPVILAAEGSVARGRARMGRVCRAADGSTLADLAELVGERLDVACTVWGDPSRPVTLFGTAPGSGRSLVGDAIVAGCDALVTGELRYHEAAEAADRGLAVIEAGHDATEWPLTRALAAVAAELPGSPSGSVVTDRDDVRWTTI